MAERKQLTKEQIKNWRRILARVVGPLTANFLTDDQIQAMRDQLQDRLDLIQEIGTHKEKEQ